ncbi:hypothetical protein [Bianquea renquensis]|jgi:hypothetical protein|uniref:Bypass of forespore C C-terminal domain-containing protein n=1 Tax=Bianquea renquensis TaxID=2763661 RepID=A0A926DT79_9FIRM|nr:hypothetical protein [Bianquea renquensis]MBC8543357.1 hypothetical protein [Bianquea renquensis]
MSTRRKVLCIVFTTVAVLIIMGSAFYGWYYLSTRDSRRESPLAEESDPQPVREPSEDLSVDLSANGNPAGESEIAQEKSSQRYTVREYEGHIGIFLEDGTLQSELKTPVELLPEIDQKKLQEGIAVNTEEELILLMESYTG